jgi:hypothetical protein
MNQDVHVYLFPSSRWIYGSYSQARATLGWDVEICLLNNVFCIAFRIWLIQETGQGQEGL